jgi:nicotinate-nucleotide--dimethylbenzimidazole phosphoribosyltransferase
MKTSPKPDAPAASDAPESADRLVRALKQRIDSQSKPPGSLGMLESIGLRLGVLQRTLTPRAELFRICVFAGNHGIASAGVSAFPAEVTVQMVGNFLQGGAAICVLARASSASLHVIDAGVLPEPPEAWTACKTFFPRARRAGTRCFLKGAAMTPQEYEAAMQAGREQVELAIRDGIHALGIGEMGIGNTTSAAALCCGILDVDPNLIVGRGTGVDDAGLERKRSAVSDALELHRTPLRDDAAARHWLESVGGYEIAAMTGCILAAAEAGLPVVVDGFIATSAALVASRLKPESMNICFFAHQSAESGHPLVLASLGVTPMLSLGLRLGEGSGAALALPLMRAAARLLSEMATFDSAGVSQAADREGES